MTADELAQHHPFLYHQTSPEALAGIQRHGLLCTLDLLKLYEVPAARQREITQRRREAGVALDHPVHGPAVVTDNLPLTEKALASCLDDGLQPADWLRMLNERVFFWPSEEALNKHLNARFNRGRQRLVLVFDTHSLAQALLPQLELTPINTGSTIRKPARRGLSTFTPVAEHSYSAWRKLRGGLDAVKEIALRGSLRDIKPHLARHHLAG